MIYKSKNLNYDDYFLFNLSELDEDQELFNENNKRKADDVIQRKKVIDGVKEGRNDDIKEGRNDDIKEGRNDDIKENSKEFEESSDRFREGSIRNSPTTVSDVHLSESTSKPIRKEPKYIVKIDVVKIDDVFYL